MAYVHRLLAAGAAALVIGFSGVGTAHADEALVLDSCVATVPDGRQIALHPNAVTQSIIQVLTPLDPLGVLVPAFRDLWGTQPPIMLPGGDVALTGSVIADAVVERLRAIPLLTPVIDVLTGPVGALLSATCGITTLPPEEDPPPGTPGGPGQPGRLPGNGGVPAPGVGGPVPPSGTEGDRPSVVLPEYPVVSGYGYGGVPGPGISPEGVAFSYNSDGIPPIGALGADTMALTLARSPGTAEVLPDPAGTGSLSRPVLLAALVLTLVSTQLVRTWLLRRAGE